MSKQFPGVDIDAVHGGKTMKPRIYTCTKCGAYKKAPADFCINPHCEWGKDHAPKVSDPETLAALIERLGIGGVRDLLVEQEREAVKTIIDALRGTPPPYVQGEAWRPMSQLPRVTQRTELLFRNGWLGRDGIEHAMHEVLWLWPDGVLTDPSEARVQPEEMPTEWTPIPAFISNGE